MRRKWFKSDVQKILQGHLTRVLIQLKHFLDDEKRSNIVNRAFSHHGQSHTHRNTKRPTLKTRTRYSSSLSLAEIVSMVVVRLVSVFLRVYLACYFQMSRESKKLLFVLLCRSFEGTH